MATRQEIRNAIKILVESEFNSSFDYRPAQVYEEELPSVSIAFEDGETERDFEGEGVTESRLVVDVMDRSAGNLDAHLDEKASEVERLINESNLLDDLVEYISRTGFAYERDPESNSGVLSLIYTVHYLDED
jgi:hypothetical protein